MSPGQLLTGRLGALTMSSRLISYPTKYIKRSDNSPLPLEMTQLRNQFLRDLTQLRPLSALCDTGQVESFLYMVIAV